MNTIHNVIRHCVFPAALAIALLICSAVWFVVCARYATSAFQDDWSATPVFWMLILMVTPAICFAIAVDLVSSRQQSRLSWFDGCALAAAFSLSPSAVRWRFGRLRYCLGQAFKTLRLCLKYSGCWSALRWLQFLAPCFGRPLEIICQVNGRMRDKWPDKSPRPAAAAPAVFDGVGDSLLPGFVKAQSAAVGPEDSGVRPPNRGSHYENEGCYPYSCWNCCSRLALRSRLQQ